MIFRIKPNRSPSSRLARVRSTKERAIMRKTTSDRRVHSSRMKTRRFRSCRKYGRPRHQESRRRARLSRRIGKTWLKRIEQRGLQGSRRYRRKRTRTFRSASCTSRASAAGATHATTGTIMRTYFRRRLAFSRFQGRPSRRFPNDPQQDPHPRTAGRNPDGLSSRGNSDLAEAYIIFALLRFIVFFLHRLIFVLVFNVVFVRTREHFCHSSAWTVRCKYP